MKTSYLRAENGRFDYENLLVAPLRGISSKGFWGAKNTLLLKNKVEKRDNSRQILWITFFQDF